MAAEITRARKDGVERIRLTRADRRNAFDEIMIARIHEAFDAIRGDADVRAVVLEAEGESFCAGADLAWMQRIAGADAEQNRLDALRMSAMFQAIASSPCPVIARVQGAALGGGAGLVAAADIAIAASDAVFGFTEVRLGIIPAVISPFVLRKVHAADTRRYFLSGERFGAAEALRIGLVQLVAEPGGLDAAVDRLLASLLSGGPSAQREVKRLLDVVPAAREEERAEITAEWIARLRASDEGREGIRSFLERRLPSWAPRKDGA